MESKHYMYVLECRDNTYYTGYTNNLEKRLKAHNSGKGAKYTRARGPVTLFFYEEFENKSEALKAEYRFKKLRRNKKEQYMEESRLGDVATEEFSKE